MKTIIAVVVAGLFAGGAAFAQDKKGGMEKSKGSAKSVTVRLGAQNNSGETGTAKLTPDGDQTKVEVSLKGAPKGSSQPSHIHLGSCAKLDPKPKYGLQNVVDGKATSTVPVKLDELLKGNMAINVHKSAEDLKTYVACGDIKPGGAAKKSAKKKE